MSAAGGPVAGPTLAIGLLGPAGSGMTSFVLAASAAAAGTGSLALRAESAAAHALAAVDWSRLLRGTFPSPSRLTGPQEHTLLLFGRGTLPARIRLTDQRGDVLQDAGHSPDFATLHGELVAADAIFIAVDGRVLGQLTPTAPGAAGRRNLEYDRERLWVHDISMALRPAVDERVRAGRTDLLLVVLITKYDAFRGATAELADAAALHAGTERLRLLMPVLFETGVTALCPVQVGPAVRSAGGGVGQRGVLAPFALAAGHALARLLRGRSADLVARIDQLGRLDRELAGVDTGTAQTAAAAARRVDLSTELVREQRAFDGLRALLARARGELRELAVYQTDRPASIGRDFVISAGTSAW